MKTTKNFDRLPSSWVSKKNSDVKFEGFKDITLKSREPAVEQVKEFIKRCRTSADGTNICAILGEWGQGKTEINNKFIEPYLKSKGDYSFFITASTLANVYEDEKLSKITNESRVDSIRFLANIFEGIREEARDDTCKKLPDLDEFVDPESYIESILDTLIQSSDTKIFIFIDEFEELLLNNTALKKIISGMKSVVNGTYGLIDKNGKYMGAIQLFMSITPDARYKLEVNSDTSLIMGGLGRRFEEVKLEEIRKEEAIEFLKGLLSYSYKDDIPHPYPIESFGLFNTIFRVSQKNIGNLLKLFIQLFNKLGKSNELEVLNYSNLINFFEYQTVYVYGAQTDCLENETYYRILKDLREHKLLGGISEKLFKLLIADQKPFDINMLKEFGNEDESTILQAINRINDDIRSKEKIDKTIIRIVPLKNDKSFYDLKNLLKNFIFTEKKIKKDVISIGNYIETLEEFRDRLTYFVDINNGFKSQIFLPKDVEDIKVFFSEQINNDQARTLESLFKNIVSEEVYYTSSDSILSTIYPAPVPRFLDYIKNNELRLDLWRKVNRNLSEEFNSFMPDAFIDCLSKSEIYDLNHVEMDEYPIIEIYDKDLELKSNTLFYSVNGDVKTSDIEYVSNLLNNNLDIHSSIILYSGEFSEPANEALINSNLGRDGKDSIIKIHLYPTVAKRLLCAFKSKEFSDIDTDLLTLEYKDIILRELDFKEKIKFWVNNQYGKGLVIDQISTSAKSFREFADILKLYLNYIDEANSPEQILEKNLEGVLKYRIYGKKRGLITSDFEDSPNIVKELSVELHDNGFLRKENGSYFVNNHPVENRILEVIEKEKKISADELQKFFIIKEKNKKVFQDVFLNIMEYKGKIERKGKNYMLLDKEQAYNSLKIEFNNYKKVFNKKAYETFGHYFVAKKRGEKLISMNKFDEYLQKNFDDLERLKYVDSEDFTLKIHLCSKLIEQFYNDFQKAIEGAFKESEKIYESMFIKKSEKDKQFNFIVQNVEKWLKIKLKEGKNNIYEYKNFISSFEKLTQIYEKKYSEEELNEVIGSSDFEKLEFKFDKSLKNAYYFNIKLYKLSKKSEELNEILSSIDKLILKNKTQFENLNSKLSRYETKIKSIPVVPKYKISFHVYEALVNVDTEIVREFSNIDDVIKLKDIEKRTKSQVEYIDDKLEKFLELVSFVKKSKEKEEKLIKSIEDNKKELEKINEIFDIKELLSEANKYESAVLRIEKEYNNINPIELEETDENPIDIIDRWYQVLELANIEVQNTWEEYQKDTLVFTSKIEDTLYIVKLDPKELDDIVVLNDNIKNVISKTIYESLPASKIESLKTNLTKELELKLEKTLEKNELPMLEILQSIKTKSKWIDYDKIIELSLERGMNQKDMEDALNGLINKGYLQRGFSLL